MTPPAEQRSATPRLVATCDGGLLVLDVGTWGEPHGDHAHHFTAAPALSGVRIGRTRRAMW